MWKLPRKLPRLLLALSATGFILCQPADVAHSAFSRQLRAGEQVERELSPCETHTYEISLSSGQYVRLVVEPRGVGAGGTLSGPDGRQVIDFHCRLRGPTPVSLISALPGVYRIDIRSMEEGPTIGRYSIRVESMRPATAQDQGRIAAERAFAEGERLRTQWQAESSRLAIEKYETALELWGAAGERREQALTLIIIGDLWQSLGESPKALNYYERARSISQSMGDQGGDGEALNGIAYISLSSGANQEALEHFDRARSLCRDAGNRAGEAQALNNLGEAYYALGNLPESLKYYEQSLAIWRDLNDRQGQALALLNRGYTYSDLSETAKALDSYNEGLLLWRAVKNRWGEAHTLTAIGHLKSKLGEKQEALLMYGEARKLFRPMGDRVGEAFVLNGMGYVYDQLGEMERAFESYGEALELFRAANYPNGEAGSLEKLGMIYYLKGDYPRALEYVQKSFSLFHRLGDRRMEPYPLKGLGMVYEALGERAKALKSYNRALRLIRVGSDRREEPYVLSGIARALEKLGERRKALAHYNQALPLNRSTGDLFGEASTLYNISRLQRDQGNLAEARLQIKAALEIAESLRLNVASQNLRTSYFAAAHQYYELYVDVLMQLHKAHPDGHFVAAALEASELARARSLLETLKDAYADVRQGVDPTLLEQEQSLQQEINNKAERQTLLLANGRAREAEEAARELDKLSGEYAEVRSRIKASSPHYAVLMEPRPLSLGEIQRQVLDDGSLLLEYSLGDERSYVWAVSSTGIAGYELPKREDVEGAARGLYELIIAHQPRPDESYEQYQARVTEADGKYWQQAAALSQMLLGPVAEHLGDKRLLIVADGALQYVPFRALTVPTPPGTAEPIPLGFQHEIINQPSMSSLAALRGEMTRRARPPKLVAVLADPVFERDDSRLQTTGGEELAALLPNESAEVGHALRDFSFKNSRGGISRLASSLDEAEAIMEAVPDGSGFKAVGFDASRETLNRIDLSQYRIVHFATHGILNNDHPELSGIVLSLLDEQGRPQNGFLRLHDIYNMNLPVDLVVLSACNTGLGKDVRGEGFIGLTRGFMYAGASSVLASLWKVEDAATAELMKHFYDALLKEGLPPAAALRKAQKAMWEQKRWRSPYYWAGFVLQGEYKENNGAAAGARINIRKAVESGAVIAALYLAGFYAVRRNRRRATVN